jgi:hypothetical protein
VPVRASRSAIAARMRRLTRLDWKQPSTRWERIERDILLEANARHVKTVIHVLGPPEARDLSQSRLAVPPFLRECALAD